VALRVEGLVEAEQTELVTAGGDAGLLLHGQVGDLGGDGLEGDVTRRVQARVIGGSNGAPGVRVVVVVRFKERYVSFQPDLCHVSPVAELVLPVLAVVRVGGDGGGEVRRVDADGSFHATVEDGIPDWGERGLGGIGAGADTQGQQTRSGSSHAGAADTQGQQRGGYLLSWSVSAETAATSKPAARVNFMVL